jgi:RHS repeat-associated protein
MSFVLTVAAFPRVPRVPWAKAVCCKRQKMSFVPAAFVFIGVHPRSKCYNCVMQPQTVSVMKKCGTGVSPVDAPRGTFANKLTNIYLGSTSANNRYFYDRAGNLEYRVVNNVTNWYDYNAQNKLARIRGVGFTNEFVYDSQNRRVAFCQNGTWRYDAHDGALPVGSFGQDRQVQNWCVRGVGIAEGTGDVIAEVDMSGASAQPYYYLRNHRGDTLVVLNSSGTVTARMRYDAFGNMFDVSTNSVYFPRYTFSTKEYLSQPKLYLYAYRVYDPVAGRWTQRDPIDYEDSINLYQFCGNNPLCHYDVDGRKMQQDDDPDRRAGYWAKVGASVGAAAGAVVGGGGGAVLGLLTGPAAVVASPSGAAAGALGGAAEGAILGAAAGAAASAMIDTMLKLADKLSPDAPNFEKFHKVTIRQKTGRFTTS